MARCVRDLLGIGVNAVDVRVARLREHVDDISRHSFETSKITQSFAAGWFAKYVAKAPPTKQQTATALKYALTKIRHDLLREAER